MVVLDVLAHVQVVVIERRLVLLLLMVVHLFDLH